MEISVCMIVRNEEAVLERCLKCAVQFADELIVVDTGSSDRTKEIAEKYTDRVYDYVWDDDFAAARNFSYEKAACDYVMWLDADDDIEREDIERIKFLKRDMPSDTDVVYFRYTGDAAEDNLFGDNEVMRDRLVRRSLRPVWVYPVHEAIPIQKEWKELYRPDIRIFHRKRRINEERRNIRIFERKLSEGFVPDSFSRSYYCRELSVDGSHERAVEEFHRLLREGSRGDIDYAMFYYIHSMKKLNRCGELRKRLEDYVETYGGQEAALCTLGDLCLRDREYERAAAWYREALALQADICDKNIHFPAYREFLPLLGIGKAYIRMGRPAEAAAALKKAERIHPSYVELKLLKLYLERMDKKHERTDEEADGSGKGGRA
ncbi:MAG: glycosyltransferase family 2 protein [Eubacteriales bacterium]|nr:glycosyltransferase family 2 protein [Eubacteriales bacterium]